MFGAFLLTFKWQHAIYPGGQMCARTCIPLGLHSMWPCIGGGGGVKNFEGNPYSWSLVIFHPCTLNRRPRQIRHTTGICESRPSLVSPKVTQSQTTVFFFFFGKPDLLLKIGIFVFASMPAPDAWPLDEIPPMPASKRLRGFYAEPEGHIGES